VLAGNGSQMSMLYIGEIYGKGLGVSVDLNEAEKWFLRLASHESVFGYFALGKLYLKQARYIEARDAFEHAVRKCYVPAMQFLARMYLYGSGGPKDLKRAEELLLLGARSGSVLAKAYLGSFYLSSNDPRNKLRGLWLKSSALMDFLIVISTKGFGSERLR
jgi:TPR repeat protein